MNYVVSALAHNQASAIPTVGITSKYHNICKNRLINENESFLVMVKMNRVRLISEAFYGALNSSIGETVQAD